MQEFITRYVESKRDDNLRDLPKLDVVSDDFVHAHLMIFCQHPRFGFLGRNLPPAALAAREPDAASLLAEVHQAILEALLNRGTADAFQDWRDDMQQYCAHVLERPPHKGGQGITPLQESTVARPDSIQLLRVSFLGLLNWSTRTIGCRTDRTSRIPQPGPIRASSRSNRYIRSLSRSTVVANGLPRHQQREMRPTQPMHSQTKRTTKLPQRAPSPTPC